MRKRNTIPPPDPQRRPPAWRFRRIQDLVVLPRRKLPLTRHDDAEVAWGRELYFAAMRDTSQEEMDLLFAKNPDFYYAFFLFLDDDRLRRNPLEARLLTGQTAPEIAGNGGLTPEIVDSYEKLFFDVRDRLGNPAWIVREILRPVARGSWDDGPPANRASSLRFFGYFGGPATLETVLAGWTGERPARPSVAVVELFHRYLEEVFPGRSPEAAAFLAAHRPHLKRLVEVHLQLLAVDRPGQMVGEREFRLLDDLRAILDTIQQASPVAPLPDEATLHGSLDAGGSAGRRTVRRRARRADR